MKTNTSKSLVLAFIIVAIIFLLFCGGALTLTLLNDGMDHGMNDDGWKNNITWMWVPTGLSFLLSVLLGWAIFKKKDV
ncbi:MAG: hypothetical protein CVV24_04605 [Ignavibacteriae bacterium HGW-Ignavibacteriae-3]|nr:MAG: hypothetical protein CVV24_04605 [Ignavibacteriae bacterium HGW-Ignavibacteriae-3]